jgi:hypothetical protein
MPVIIFFTPVVTEAQAAVHLRKSENTLRRCGGVTEPNETIKHLCRVSLGYFMYLTKIRK